VRVGNRRSCGLIGVGGLPWVAQKESLDCALIFYLFFILKVKG